MQILQVAQVLVGAMIIALSWGNAPEYGPGVEMRARYGVVGRVVVAGEVLPVAYNLGEAAGPASTGTLTVQVGASPLPSFPCVDEDGLPILCPQPRVWYVRDVRACRGDCCGAAWGSGQAVPGQPGLQDHGGAAP